MIIIPCLETVVILPPRTGTKTLSRAILENYSDAMFVYRHMEADGIPRGYERFRKIGIARHPLDRMWSLYKRLEDFGLNFLRDHDETYTRKMRESVQVPFENWLLDNELPFTTPYDSAGRGRYYPFYTVMHLLPENRKSQWVYLRPDLGTDVIPFHKMETIYIILNLPRPVEKMNASREEPRPEISEDAARYIAQWFSWDLAVVGDSLFLENYLDSRKDQPPLSRPGADVDES